MSPPPPPPPTATSWTNTKDEWKNTVPMSCEENLVAQAVLMKNETPDSRVWVYRNTVLAMPWFASVRRIMEDPAYRVLNRINHLQHSRDVQPSRPVGN